MSDIGQPTDESERRELHESEDGLGRLDIGETKASADGSNDTETGVPPLTAIATNGLLENLKSLLEESTKKAAFAIGGTIPVTDIGDSNFISSPPVIVRWDSPKSDSKVPARVTFPLLETEQSRFEKLVSDCQPASFGRGNKDVYDEDYRKAGKMDESEFSSNFNPYSLGIVDTISQILLPSITTATKVDREVFAELYKLNVYSAPSGKFKPHVDTPRSTSQFGSLVVCLPSAHEGGQLVVRHGNDEVTFDWSGNQAEHSISWAAFYSDCEHEVFEVTGGHRVTLTYNLYVTMVARPRSFEALDPTSLALYIHVRDMLAQPGFMTQGGLLGLYCAHAYAHTVKQAIKSVPMNLKGIDMIAYRVLTAAGLKVALRPVADNKFDDYFYSDPDYIRSQWKDEWGDIDEWVTSERDPRTRLTTAERSSEANSRAFRLESYRDALKFGKKGRSILGKKLIPLVVSNIGGEGDDYPDIYNAWASHESNGGKTFAIDRGANLREQSLEYLTDVTHDMKRWRRRNRSASPPYDIVKVCWLNEATHREPALVHMTYGNEAGIDTIYSSAALIITVPPFHARSAPHGE